jgi:hypothetical protein
MDAQPAQDTHVGPVLPERAPSEGPRSTAARRSSPNKGLARRLNELKKKYDSQFRIVFDAIRELMAKPEPKVKRIGFKT